MNLLLSSLRRVEIRIEPQTITDFLKWKNRMQQYNGGVFPAGIEPAHEERNYFLESEAPEAQRTAARVVQRWQDQVQSRQAGRAQTTLSRRRVRRDA